MAAARAAPEALGRPARGFGPAFAGPEGRFNKAELTVGRQLQRIGEQLLRRQTKTDESDDTLPPGYLRHGPQDRPRAAGSGQSEGEAIWQGSELIFTTPNFNRAWGAGAGLPDITVHDARRTCGSLPVDLEVHPLAIMQILRHADFSITTEIYAKVSPKQTREALKRLGESLDAA